MHSPFYQYVEQTLREELEQARDRLNIATVEFHATMANLPTGIPAPDGVPYLKSVGARRHETIADFSHALRRFNEFVLSGKVPEDLLPE